MLTAPLDKLTGSTQAQDIAASRGPNDVFRDCYRVKAYIKWQDVQPYTHPATWEFPQPFQVAAARTGLPWDVCNRVFLGQLAGCNLDCDFCYRSEPGETVEVTPEEYVDAFCAYNDEFPENRSGVLRISGGEPFLYQEWVTELIMCANDQAIIGPEFYCWVDTNLTIPATDDLIFDLADDHETIPHIGICGCFKPGLWDLAEQIANAQALVEAGADVYFYWPSSDDLSLPDFEAFLGCLELAIPFAPLRLTVLNIKYNYEAVKAKNKDWEEKHRHAQLGLEYRRQEWQEWCTTRYPAWMVNAPSHEIAIGRR